MRSIRLSKGTGLAVTSVVSVMAMAGAIVFTDSSADAHCQVPCGIYDDAARIARLKEDAATIAKAIDHMGKLAGSHHAQGMNQLIRWTNTKEDHASHIISVVSEYFLTQKVKPKASGDGDYDKYLASLADHHAVMVAAMKCKQNADAKYVDELLHAIDGMAKHY